LPGLPNLLLVGEVFREYSKPWEGLARRYIKSVWECTKSFVEQALQYLTDATVSDAPLRYLRDPVLDNKLKLAYAKLDELIAVHKEHPETRNHFFTDMYNALQRKDTDAKSTEVLQQAFEDGNKMTEEDTPSTVAMLRERTEADMDLVAATSIFNAMEAFYKVSIWSGFPQPIYATNYFDF
jgi:hypothetical protein